MAVSRGSRSDRPPADGAPPGAGSLKRLTPRFQLDRGVRPKSNDERDAIVCAIAAAEFLHGRAVAPVGNQQAVARQEGWIWVGDPQRPPTTPDELAYPKANSLQARPIGSGAEARVWLTELKNRGVFLVDLMLDPVDGSELTARVPDLVARCRLLQPERIILIKASVYDAAYQSLKAAGLPVVDKRIPFPSTGHQGEFRLKFGAALKLCGWR
jgi:hypothetical protein